MTWVVNLEDATATHPDGWVFRFAAVEGEAGLGQNGTDHLPGKQPAICTCSIAA